LDYQKIACWGDSQTSGARSYGCYPLYLGQILNRQTRYSWQAISLATNGYTARDLWHRVSADLLALTDVHQACVLIGANDVGHDSPLDTFEEYYRQILTNLEIHGFKAVYCGEIPPIWPDGHAFFAKSSEFRRDEFNQRIKKVVSESSIATLVGLAELEQDCFTDPVHLNEKGNLTVATHFAEAIRNH